MQFTTLISALLSILAISTIVDAIDLDSDSLAVSKTNDEALLNAIYSARTQDRLDPLEDNGSGCKGSHFYFIKGCSGETVFDNPYKWIDESGRGKEVLSEKELAFGQFLQNAGRDVLQCLVYGGVLGHITRVSTFRTVVVKLVSYAKQIKDYLAYYAITYAKFVDGFVEATDPSRLSVVALRVWKFLKKVFGSEEFQILKLTWTVGSVTAKHASFWRYRDSTEKRYNNWKEATGNRYNDMLQQVNLLIGTAEGKAHKNAYLHAMEDLQTANKKMDMGYGKM